MNDDIEKRINALLDRGKKLLTRIKIYEGELNYWCDENDIPEFQAWLASAVNILNVAATPDSFFQKECTRLVSHDDLKRSVPTHIVQKLTGLLSSILEESNLGLLKRAEYIFTANTFDDFLEHASEYHKAGKKIESAVLACAVFEDAVRKIASKNQVSQAGIGLDQVIDNLVKSGALPAIKAKRAKSYAAVRNKALHAQWDDFDIRDVGEVINGTRELVEGFL